MFELVLVIERVGAQTRGGSAGEGNVPFLRAKLRRNTKHEITHFFLSSFAWCALKAAFMLSSSISALILLS